MRLLLFHSFPRQQRLLILLLFSVVWVTILLLIQLPLEVTAKEFSHSTGYGTSVRTCGPLLFILFFAVIVQSTGL